MSDTLTANYSLTKIEVGGSNDSWGAKINANSDAIDAALHTIALAAAAATAAAGAALPSASYTAADVLAKMLTVDGAASGLDADLLDGRQGVEYLLASAYTAADVLAKIKTVDGSGSGLDAELLAGQPSSYFTDIAARLGYTPFSSAGGTISGATTVSGNLTSSGTVTAAEVIATSDERLKENITPLDGDAMLAAIQAIGGHSYRKDGRDTMGVIAQRVQAAGLSNLVAEADDRLAVNYFGLVGALIAAVSRLSERVAELEAR